MFDENLINPVSLEDTQDAWLQRFDAVLHLAGQTAL